MKIFIKFSEIVNGSSRGQVNSGNFRTIQGYCTELAARMKVSESFGKFWRGSFPDDWYFVDHRTRQGQLLQNRRSILGKWFHKLRHQDITGKIRGLRSTVDEKLHGENEIHSN
jgi:hypothetical protein